MTENKIDRIGNLLSQAKIIARQYWEVTGKPLGITGEIAEYEAASRLDLELSEARQSGYDAIRKKGKKVTRVQIKGRQIPANAKSGQRIGSIRLEHDWDTLVLVILNEDFEPVEMYEAERKYIESALKKPGSKARNIRGALSISKFKSISQMVWSKDMVST